MTRPRMIRAALIVLALGASPLTACAGYGPLGEPEGGIAGLKAAERQHETAKIGQPGLTPQGGGSAIAPTGPEGSPTAGPTDSIGPH